MGCMFVWGAIAIFHLCVNSINILFLLSCSFDLEFLTPNNNNNNHTITSCLF